MKLDILPPEEQPLHAGAGANEADVNELATEESQASIVQESLPEPAQNTSTSRSAQIRDPNPLTPENNSDEATISQLRRDLQEAEMKAKVWRSQADETLSQLVQSMAENSILKRDLESTTAKLREIEESKGTSVSGVVEVEALEALTDELLQVKTTSQTRITELWEALNAAKDEVAIANIRLSDADESMGDSQADLLLLNAQLESTREGLRVLEETSRSKETFLRATIESLTTELANARQTAYLRVQDLQSQLQGVKGRLSAAVNLAEARRRELEDSTSVPVDKRAATDIKRLVDTVNQEIFECAAYLSDVIVNQEFASAMDRQENRETVIVEVEEDAKNMLGDELANRLAQASMRHPAEGENIEAKDDLGEETQKVPVERSNPLLIQIAMQIALTNQARTLTRRWVSLPDAASDDLSTEHEKRESHPDYNTFLSQLHNRIRDNEDQATSGLWRSLTRTYTPFSTQTWKDTLLVGIYAVMNIAGWTTRPNVTDLESQLETRLASRFLPLLEDLRNATGQDIILADYEIAIVKPGIAFDTTWMEDAYPDRDQRSTVDDDDDEGEAQQAAAEPLVVGTTGIGLGRHVMQKTLTGEVQGIAEVWSMPKVVLEKTLEEALSEPRRTPLAHIKTSQEKKTQAVAEGGLENLDLLLELLGTRA
ncbi:hypothetical protein MD484_g8245, partial [Candolleomyces efflorescens]